MTRRLSTTLTLAAALLGALPACTLVWEPVLYDAAEPPDAGNDGWAPDADLDAAPIPDASSDAFVPVDAWIPHEICAVPIAGGSERLEGADNDGDGLVDCADPDCFGDEICCSDSLGSDLGGDFVAPEPPIGWTRTNALVSAATGGFVGIDFGTTGGNVRRRSCMPLAAGARLSVEMRRGGAGSGDLSLVLSPAAEAMPSGFLDEVALRFEASTGRFQVTRAGVPIPLTPLAGTDCAAIQTSPTSYDIDEPTRVVVDVRPGVSDDTSAMLVTVEVFFAGIACTSVRPVVDAAIEVRDLIHTSEGRSESCDDSPGLYVVLEGHGDAYQLGTHVTLTRFECASPAVFATVPDVLQREDLSASVPTTDDFAAGGIGAPDLDYDSGQWRLTYDGSLEDRSGEIFVPLTMRIGESLSANLLDWRGVPVDDGTPVVGTPMVRAVREPSGLFDLTDVMVFSVERIAMDGTPTGRFDLYRAGTSTSGDGNWVLPGSPVVANEALLACSFREAALAHARGGDHWVFTRCDAGTSSKLVALRLPETGAVTVVSDDVLASIAPSIASHVRAVDVVTSTPVSAGASRYFAVWVLAEAEGSRSVHLFVGEAPDGSFPDLHGYAGNPVLLDADLREACTGACEITSFGVGLEPRAGSDLLHFLFARSRTETGGTVHELIRRSQFAPSPLDDRR